MRREKISIRIKGRPERTMESAVIGGRYAVQRELGRGGVGEVFLARDQQLERMVAVKRIYLEMGEDVRRTEFAIGEARKLALLQHPNIVTVFDVLHHGDDVYMVMEYLGGLTLGDLKAPLTLDDFINVARQTLGGLAAAHALGMIHLDIKSTNIMLTWLATGQFQVKLLDFGLATMLEQASREDENDGTVFGSVYTMAPEQLERKPVDVRTDLYSLGCVFYHALTGKDPFRGPTVEAIIDAHLDHEVKPLASRRPDLPEGVVSWIETMMSRDPAGRPASALEALKLLLSSLTGSSIANVRSAARGAEDRPEIHLPAKEALLAALGREAAVNGEVERVGENLPGTIRFLNFKTVQHNDFAVILPLRNGHPEFARERLDALVGKTIRVTGKISDFHGSPQIVVDSPSQIAVPSPQPREAAGFWDDPRREPSVRSPCCPGAPLSDPLGPNRSGGQKRNGASIPMNILRLFLCASLGAGLCGPLHAAPPAKPRESFFLKSLRDTFGIDAVRREFVFGKLPDRDLALDIYYPRTPPPPGGYPVILWLHGGGWILGSKRQDVFVRHFPMYGFAIASIEYRLAPGEVFPTQIRDVRTAAWWLHKHADRLELDPTKFVVAGQSAGGHLALLLGLTQGRAIPGWGPALPTGTIKAIAALYPPTDLLRLVPPSARDNPIHPVALLLGDEVRKRQPLARAASPVRYASPDDPPTLLFHGSEDPIVPLEQSEIMGRKLKAAGVPTELLVTPAGHAFTLYPDRVEDILNFLHTVPALDGAGTARQDKNKRQRAHSPGRRARRGVRLPPRLRTGRVALPRPRGRWRWAPC